MAILSIIGFILLVIALMTVVGVVGTALYGILLKIGHFFENL